MERKDVEVEKPVVVVRVATFEGGDERCPNCGHQMQLWKQTWEYGTWVCLTCGFERIT